MMLRLAVGCAGLLLAAGAAPLFAASFDCSKAKSATEKTVCADPALSALDEKMADAFKKAAALDKRFAAYLRKSQRDWLRDRDEMCRGNPDCLKRDYERRVAYLGNPYLKYEGVYKKSPDRNAMRLVVWASHPEPGVSVQVWGSASSKGNIVLEGRATVSESGQAVFKDAGCEYRIAFALEGAKVSDSGKCILTYVAGAYTRDFGISAFEEEK